LSPLSTTALVLSAIAIIGVLVLVARSG